MKNKCSHLLSFPFLLFFLFILVFTVKTENISQELSGDIIFYDKCNNTQNPVRNAFDGNLNTYFSSCAPFGNWIGLDLKEKYIITKIVYAPRMDVVSGSDYRERLRLGVFEGANNPDFGDAVTLFVIPGNAERKLTEQEIACTKAFRYLRFVFPYAQDVNKSSYMSELKFYGYKGVGDHTKLPQITNLPTISIHTVDGRDVDSKVNYVKGIISLVYDNGTKFYTDSLEIRGRGNNSWTHPKKPYRIKLAKSVNLMELPAKARNWTLINNYGDKTLMRNILAFDFSRRLEMPYTSPSEAVDVVLNGDYKGCYQLCDHIDIRKNRVDIEEMSTADLTGGYMLEIDAYAYNSETPEPKKFTSTRYNIPVAIKYPADDEIVLAQEQYIASHFNKLADAVNSSQYKDAQYGFRKYLDEESFIRHFLVGEFSGNTDTYWSVRMWKSRTDDKFYLGPVWDFDLGFDNDNRTYPINTKANQSNEWLCFSGGSSAAGSTREFVRRIMSDEKMLLRLKEIYSYYRDRKIISKDTLLKIVDDNAELLNQSQALNFKRWPIMNLSVHQNPVVWGSYQAEVGNVRNYVANRLDWMDKKLTYTPTNRELPVVPKISLTTDKNRIFLNNQSGSEACRVQIADVCGTIITERTYITDFTYEVRSGVYIVVVTDHNAQQYTFKCLVP